MLFLTNDANLTIINGSVTPSDLLARASLIEFEIPQNSPIIFISSKIEKFTSPN